MALDFKILRGNKENLIDENGNSKLPEEKLVNGYWYLTNDTAEVFVCLEVDGHLTLRKINECNVPSDFPEFDSFERRLEALEANRTHCLPSRKEFPAIGEKDHLYIAENVGRTYVYCNETYLPIADKFNTEDHDENPDTPDVRIIFGGSAKQ